MHGIVDIAAGSEADLSRSSTEIGRSSLQQPGLNSRHRDKSGEIGRKHGNALVSTLRRIYG
jgi:hypothetical protein